MYVIDRLFRLCQHYGCEIKTCQGGCSICSPEEHGKHEVLDALDARVGIDSSGGRQSLLFRATPAPVNPVGARVALHEAALSRRMPEFHHPRDRCGLCLS